MKCAYCEAVYCLCQKFCGTCGKEVKIENSKLRKCHSCSSLLKQEHKFCTKCGQHDTFLCKGKKEDGSPCNNDKLTQTDRFCSQCGTRTDKQLFTNETSGKSPDINMTVEVQKTDTSGKSLDINMTDEGHTTETSGKSPDINITVEGQKTETSGKSPDINMTVEGQKTDTSGKSLDINMTDEGHTTETSGKSPDINMTVEGQKTDPSGKRLDINMTVEGQKTDPSGKSPNNNEVEESHKKGWNPRGLVVICWHSTFKKNKEKKFALLERPSAENDAQMMKESWQLYGYKVIEFRNKDKSFYNNEMISKIKEALETIPDIRLFVFVLSTHGWENLEVKVGNTEKQVEHYFFTNDDQVYTQDLMERISDIEKFKDKPKLFVIQACRSRSEVKEHLKEDLGYELKVTKVSETSPDSLNCTAENKTKLKSQDGKDMADASGHIPDVDDMHTTPELSAASQINVEQIIEVDKGEEHVKCSMPPEDKEDIHIHPDVSTGSKNNTEQVKEVDGGKATDETMELIPHCDDCIVLFASMTGKEAYCKKYSEKESGGWLIKALSDTLTETKNREKKVHLLDILTEVNSKVGKREHSEKEVKAQSCFFHNIAFDEAELYLG